MTMTLASDRAESGDRLPPHPLPRTEPVQQPARPRRRFARPFVALAVFVLLVVALNLAAVGLVDSGPPDVRDPEYGLRLNSLRQRVKENPGRPLVVVVGSSRSAQGIRPGVCEPSDGPLVFNMSQSGGGPISQVLTLRRLRADGVTPAGVVLEYWPPFLRGDGSYHEQNRFDATRLRPVDEPTVREFFLTPEDKWAARRGGSVVPLIAHRHVIMNRYWPETLPPSHRTEFTWKQLDGWGWWPGRETLTAEQIETAWPITVGWYRPMYEGFTIHPQHAAAYRIALAECRVHGVPVVLLRMPETERFMKLQTANSERLGEEFLNDVVRDFGVPVIDGRTWATDDAHLPDGFHLTQPGAEAFTRRLVPEVRKLFR